MNTSTTAAPPSSEPSSEPTPVGAHLLGAFFCGLLMVVPTYAALEVESSGALALWMLGAVVGALLLGLVLRQVLRFGFALCVAAAGAFSLSAVIGIAIVAAVGDPPGNGTLALLVGLPASGLAAVLATLLVHHAREAAAGVGLAFSAVLLMITFVVGPAAGDAILDARHDAAMVEKLEEAGLSPYLPEIGDLQPSFSSTSVQDGRITGYSLRYEKDSDELFAPYVSVDVGPLQSFHDCDTTESALYDCREGDGYYVLEDDGETEYVVATNASTPITASYGSEGPGGLPDADQIGKALAAAENASWDDIIDLD